MPNYVKSGKYFYKVNKKTGDKTRISKEEYNVKSKKNTNKKIVKDKQINKRKLYSNKSDNSMLNMNSLIKEKLKKVNKSVLLNSMIGINFDVRRGKKLYNIKARLGKCPKSGYYVYRVNAQDVSDNSMSYSVFSRSLISTDIDILREVI